LYKHFITPFPIKKSLFWDGLSKDTNDTRESAAIYVADDLINENAKLLFMILKCREKMLADLDYLESRTTEKNTNSMQSFENPYEACKEAHHSCTYGMG
jgi:UDPglucose 6-dehydrogenase